jgi:hypothetical protein
VGLSPFLIVVGEEPNAKKAEQQMLQYSLLHSGHMAPTMSQLTTLVTWAPPMPDSTLSLLMIFQALATLFDTVHGKHHIKSQAFHDEFLPEIATRLPILEHTFQTKAELETILQCCLHFVQLVSTCFDAQCYDQGPALTAAPAYMNLIEMVDMWAYAQLLHMPSSYLTSLTADADPLTLESTNQCCSWHQETAPACDLTPITNVSPSATIKHWFDVLGREVKELTKDSAGRPCTDLPLADNGSTALCFAYHFHFHCIRGCDQASTHHRLTSPEEGHLSDFLTAEGAAL